jgi:Radical SAM superfamily
MTTRRILLVYPPHARNTEPPLGISLIAADMKAFGIDTHVLDLNAAAAPDMARGMEDGVDHRTHRAFLHVNEAISQLKRDSIYKQPAQYRTAIGHYAQALRSRSTGQAWTITPGDYRDDRYPGFSGDTARRAYENPEESPFTVSVVSQLEAMMKRLKPDLVGLSIIYRTQFLPALALAGWIHQHFNKQSVLMGGGFCKALGEDPVNSIQERVGPVVSGRGEPYLRTYFQLRESRDPDFVDPDYSSVDFDSYFAPGRIIPVTSSLGCYWGQCRFCAEREQYYQNDPQQFAAQLHRLAERFNPTLFHLTDNAIPPQILKVLVDRSPGIPWYGFVRVTRDLASYDFVQALADSGCRMLQLGFETGSPDLLKRMGKGVDSALYSVILKNLERAGIKQYGYVMFGFPTETDADRQATLELISDNPLDFLNASIFRIPPGSYVAGHPEDFGLTDLEDDTRDSLYCHATATESQRSRLRQWLSACFYRHPRVRSCMARTPQYYKSNHAVFF